MLSHQLQQHESKQPCITTFAQVCKAPFAVPSCHCSANAHDEGEVGEVRGEQASLSRDSCRSNSDRVAKNVHLNFCDQFCRGSVIVPFGT
eukprot:7960-Heterococcus_DN1.PRE.2